MAKDHNMSWESGRNFSLLIKLFENFRISKASTVEFSGHCKSKISVRLRLELFAINLIKRASNEHFKPLSFPSLSDLISYYQKYIFSINYPIRYSNI